MIWPPVKAWQSKALIDGQRYFVAVNYGGKDFNRWVILISVLDSNVVVKVSWSKLTDPYAWECGWEENRDSSFPELVNEESEIRISNCIHPSNDSGLTIPITKNKIRPWITNV